VQPERLDAGLAVLHAWGLDAVLMPNVRHRHEHFSYLSSTGQYVFLCSYYDRPALVQISGPDHASLAAWWHTMEPVFSG
jgi:hypothetical protein